MTESFPTKVGEDIKRWRERWGHTQKDAAAFIGTTPQFLNDIEHGRRELTDKRILSCPQSELRGVLVDARVRELRHRISWLKAQRDDKGAVPHAAE